MLLILVAGIVLPVEDVIQAGDVDVGDVIALAGADEAALVRMVRLGQGRLFSR